MIQTISNNPSCAPMFGLELERHTLRNGLRFVLNPDPSVPIVCVNVWYQVGSRNDPAARSGTAHLLEHMLFQGGGVADDFRRRIHALGGTANGSTWYDRTTYFEVVPAHALELTLWLEANRLQLVPPLSQERLAVQRTVLLNERREMRDMRPYGRAHELLNELVFPPGHPYRMPPMGLPDHIDRIELQDLLDFFRAFYVPRNAVLTLSGDFDPEQACILIDRYFGRIEDRSHPLAAAPPASDFRPQQVSLREAVDLPRVYIAFRLPPYGDHDWYAADLLGAALATGRSSLLQRELVHRRQWALDVACAVVPTEWGATLTATVACCPGVDPDRVRDFVLGLLDNMGAEPVSEAAVNRCRNRMLTQCFRDLQLLDRRADTLSRLTAQCGAPEALFREIDVYRGLDSEDLSDVAARHMRPDQAAVLLYLPRE
jgi:zinc protease